MITQEEFKAHIGGIQSELEFSTVLPFVNTAAIWFRNEIGQGLYNLLAGTPPANTHATYQMYHLARAVVSWRTYELVFPHLKIRIGDVGMMKNAPANTIAITKWEYTDTIDSIRKMLDQHLENLWYEIELSKPTQWTSSPNYTIRRGMLIDSPAMLDRYVGMVGNNYRIWQKLVMHVNRAEELYLRRIATKEVVVGLKAKLTDINATLANQETELLEAIRRALAPLTMYEAYPHLSLVADENGIRQVRFKDGTSEQEFPEAGLRNAHRQQLWNDGQLYLGQLKTFLDETASTTLFPTYHAKYLATPTTSDLYEDQKDHSQVLL